MASTLSSASTDQQVWDAFDNSASYAEDNSTAKAAAFITACTILLRRTAKRALHGRTRSEVETSPEMIRELMNDARRWLAARSTGRIIHPDLRNLRD